MATVPRDMDDEVAPLAETVERALSTIAITTQPVVIIGVNRKVNIGNFENIDVYAGLALPIPGASVERLDELREVVEQVADEGMKIAAAETYKRYASIKELITGQTS